jgi:c-di-AMP phosphodiesterase-like protein
MQLNFDLIKRSIQESSNVIIMSHRSLDLDALGSSLGVYYLCKSLDKDAHILIDDVKNEAGVQRSLDEIGRQKLSISIKKWATIKEKVDEGTLLIIIDTHIESLVQCKDALSIKNKIILDHHICDDNNSIKCNYEYINENESSSTEIIIDILKELDVYISSYVSTVMLAGIFVDTKGFFRKTSAKTHEAAAYLYNYDAMLDELQYLLKEDVEKFNDMQQVISNAQIIKNHFIIAACNDKMIYNKEDLAKMSDKMLLFNNIEVSFTIGRIDKNMIGISARSLGNISVEKIMESLGGGGHTTDAATQLENETIMSVLDKLKIIVNNL